MWEQCLVNRNVVPYAQHPWNFDYYFSILDEVLTLFVEVEDQNYAIANLKKGENVHLDLNFEQGTKINFHSKGNGTIHLTGKHFLIIQLSLRVVFGTLVKSEDLFPLFA